MSRAIVAVAAALACAGAQAQTTATYNFGTALTGSLQPSSSFASLAVTTSNGADYSFDLRTTAEFGSLFNNSDAFIGRVLFKLVFALRRRTLSGGTAAS